MLIWYIALEDICTLTIQILEQKALCQNDPDQDDNDEAPEDQAEYDSVLISSAGDLVASLAEALGADFAPAFGTFFPLISKFYVSGLYRSGLQSFLMHCWLYRKRADHLAIVHLPLDVLLRSSVA